MQHKIIGKKHSQIQGLEEICYYFVCVFGFKYTKHLMSQWWSTAI